MHLLEMCRNRSSALCLKESTAALAWVAQDAVGKWELDLGVEKLLVVNRCTFNIYQVRRGLEEEKKEEKKKKKKTLQA
jgi:hypothetical protein